MKKCNLLLLVFSLLAFLSCDEVLNEKIDVNSSEKIVEASSEKMEAIYYSIPSPMETTIILKRSYSKFSGELLFPVFNLNKIHDNQSRALLLGIISTDLNYAMLSERKFETNRLINQVIEIAQLLHLDAIVNVNTKERIEKNLDNKDSMQIIIGNTFWEIENKLKNDDKEELSALIVAGGWIEGLYLASNMSALDPENKPLQNVIADQKIVHENLIALISDFTFQEKIQEYFISKVNNLQIVFNEIVRVGIAENNNLIKEKNGEIVIGNYFNLKFEKEDLNEIYKSVSNIRKTILNQLL
jgi:hypothetical protein